MGVGQCQDEFIQVGLPLLRHNQFAPTTFGKEDSKRITPGILCRFFCPACKVQRVRQVILKVNDGQPHAQCAGFIVVRFELLHLGGVILRQLACACQRSMKRQHCQYIVAARINLGATMSLHNRFDSFGKSIQGLADFSMLLRSDLCTRIEHLAHAVPIRM